MELTEHRVLARVEFDEPADRGSLGTLANKIDDRLTSPSQAIANGTGISVEWQFKAATYDEAFSSVARRILDCVEELGGRPPAGIRDLRTDRVITSRHDL